jgi:hypothetical protein
MFVLQGYGGTAVTPIILESSSGGGVWRCMLCTLDTPGLCWVPSSTAPAWYDPFSPLLVLLFQGLPTLVWHQLYVAGTDVILFSFPRWLE